MSHTIREKAKLLARVHRIAGQVQAVVRALEAEAECGEVLQRIAAARGAMNGLMSEVLEDHVRAHVLSPRSVKAADRERFADDLTHLVRRYLK
ncbi:MAG TPA: metal/formaldehyde-sensitive transcriptional repressor [Candidatus Baltobacteraceae bacterium]|nr:metal/formaldehyde-sensitive transcriptional repressor [Candidatus Baltobacteraceae bacterium]